MNYRSGILLFSVVWLGGGCAEEPVPPTVDEFLADKILLDATMVRCAQDRSRTKYEAECVVAREAANVISREEEAEKRKLLEAQSQRRRAALRRAQEAADEARRRAAEAERLRRETEYLAQFESAEEGTALPQGDDASDSLTSGAAALQAGSVTEQTAEMPSVAGPAVQDTTTMQESGSLESVREELRRRQEGSH